MTGKWQEAIQAHHLLYFPVNYWIYRGLQSLFHYRVLEFFHLQIFSMFFGVASLFVSERLLRRFGIDWPLRLAGVALVALANVFWVLAVDAEVHVPGFFFVLAGLTVMLGRRTAGRLSGAALLLALAAGFHLTNMLILPASIAFLLMERASWRELARFALVYFAALSLLYAAYAIVSAKAVFAIFHSGLFVRDAFSGYHIAFARSPSWATAMTALLAVKKALLAGAGFVPLLAAALLAGLSLAAAAGAIGQEQRRLRRILLCWTVPYLLFFSIWDPANPEFKLHVAAPLLLLAILALSRLRAALSMPLALFLAGTMLVVNGAAGIVPQSRIANNTDYHTAIAIGRATPANAQVLILGRFESRAFGLGKAYIPYFANRETLVLDWLLGHGHSLPDIVSELSRRSRGGRPVYVLEEIADSGEALTRLFDFHEVPPQDRACLTAQADFLPIADLPGRRRLFKLKFPAS